MTRLPNDVIIYGVIMSIENFPTEHQSTFEEMERELGDPERLRLPVDLEKLREEVAEEGLKKLIDSTIQYCERYTESVAAYKELLADPSRDKADQAQLDMTEHVVHDATVDAINILARELKKAGYDTRWIASFRSRAEYGRLALFTTYRILERQVPNQNKERVDHEK